MIYFKSNIWYFVHLVFDYAYTTLQWHHNQRVRVSNHRRLDSFLNSLFRHRSKKRSKLRITGLCEGNPPVDSPHKGPVLHEMFPLDDVIMTRDLFYKTANPSHQSNANLPLDEDKKHLNIFSFLSFGLQTYATFKRQSRQHLSFVLVCFRCQSQYAIYINIYIYMCVCV